MENPFAVPSTGVSLKDEAQRRAMGVAVVGGPSFHNTFGSSEIGNNSSCDFVSDQSPLPTSPQVHPLFENNNSNNNNSNNHHHQQQVPFSSPEMASQARKDWRRHGSNLTQTLEDKRRQTEQQFLSEGGGLMRKPGALVVRVVSAEKRVDLSGAKYSSYVIRVQFANPSSPPENKNNRNGSNITSNLVEHRYSEFAKINALFKKHGIVLDDSAAFPSKSWAGRVGNWTPSLTVAPSAHDELVNYRVIQLDCWLVHVVNMYNEGTLPMDAAQALYDFLAAPSKPPCQNTNEVNNTAGKWHPSWSNPISFTLGSAIRQATRTVQYMCQDPYKLNQSDQSIPLDLLHAAQGMCFLTVAKAGLIVSGRIGTGLLVARMDDPDGNIRWSAPCAIGTVGLGWGALAGADVTHYLVVLTTQKAVQDMCNGKSIQLGAEMGVAVGPIGRGANSHLRSGDWTLHPAYAYAHSAGLFVGMSLEGSIVSVRNDVNAKFYGQQVSAPALLTLAGPKAAEPLYQALDQAMREPIPEDGFRPSTFWTEKKYGYENHPQRPVYTNEQSPMPPPVWSGQGQACSGEACFGNQNNVVNTSPTPQQAGSGTMESYHQTSTIIPASGSMYGSSPFQTIATMSPGPQALFDASSPAATNNRSSSHWY